MAAPGGFGACVHDRLANAGLLGKPPAATPGAPAAATTAQASASAPDRCRGANGDEPSCCDDFRADCSRSNAGATYRKSVSGRFEPHAGNT